MAEHSVARDRMTANSQLVETPPRSISLPATSSAALADWMGSLREQAPFLLGEFLVGKDSRVAQGGQFTQFGGDTRDRASC